MLCAATRALIELRMAHPAEKGTGCAADAAAAWNRQASQPPPPAPRSEVIRAVCADLQLISERIARDGEAVVDDTIHVEWLADIAWNLSVEVAACAPEAPPPEMDAAAEPRAGGGGAAVADVEMADVDSAKSSEAIPPHAPTSDTYPALARPPVHVPNLMTTTCSDLVSICYELTAALPQTEARLHSMLRSQAIVTRLTLRLAAECGPAGKAPDRQLERSLLGKASKAIAAAFQLHSKLSSGGGGAGAGVASAGGDALAPQLQSLNYEVALRRADPNAKAILHRVSETEGVSAAHLRHLAELSLSCKSPELGKLGFEQVLTRLVGSEPPDHNAIVCVLRRLIKMGARRADALPYLVAAASLLEPYSARGGNCPMGEDELQWLLSESWNKGVHALRDGKLEEAERFMSLAFRFCGVSPSLGGWREELGIGYSADTAYL